MRRLLVTFALCGALCGLLILTGSDTASMFDVGTVARRVIAVTVVLAITGGGFLTGRLIGGLLHYGEGLFLLLAALAVSVVAVLLPITSIVVPLGFPAAVWSSLCYVLATVGSYREFLRDMPAEDL